MDDRRGSMSRGLDEAYFLDLLGDAYNGLGRYDEAVVALSSAVKVFEEQGAQCAHAVGLFKLAQSHLALAQHDQAIGYLEECLPIFRKLHLTGSEQRARAALDACLLVIA
ncbi:MAG TPA: tetratricopeptide repeat protein [Streptosporangiaceae bacterium]|nr:tetratricopeptide repeat protein [Streptosporangiaceae bacterium]